MAVLLLFISAGLAACVSVGRPIDQSAADKIEKGKTTREQVISLMGSPDQITSRGDGSTVFSYHYMRATAKPATFIPIVGAFAGGANVQNQMFIVTLGSDGVVKDFFSTRGGTEADKGFSTGSKAEIPEVEEGKRPK
jgi:outer membrane protein assembly factor BamE (lipoprotein component of BamABCDE complex)